MTDNTPLNADDELRESIEDLISQVGNYWFCVAKETSDSRTLSEGEAMKQIMHLIQADRKKHEIQARLNEVQNAYEYWINGRKFISSYFRDRIALLSNTKESKDE